VAGRWKNKNRTKIYIYTKMTVFIQAYREVLSVTLPSIAPNVGAMVRPSRISPVPGERVTSHHDAGFPGTKQTSIRKRTCVPRQCSLLLVRFADARTSNSPMPAVTDSVGVKLTRRNLPSRKKYSCEGEASRPREFTHSFCVNRLHVHHRKAASAEKVTAIQRALTITIAIPPGLLCNIDTLALTMSIART
jgi:hypothetical protein